MVMMMMMLAESLHHTITVSHLQTISFCLSLSPSRYFQFDFSFLSLLFLSVPLDSILLVSCIYV